MLNWAQIAKHSALVAAEQLWSRLHSSTLLDWNSYSKPWAVEARYWTHRPNPTLGMRYHEHPAEHTPMRPVGSHQTLISGSKVVKRGPNSYIYIYKIYISNPTSKIFQIWRVPDISYDMLWLIYDSYHQEIPFGARLLSRQGAKSTFSWDFLVVTVTERPGTSVHRSSSMIAASLILEGSANDPRLETWWNVSVRVFWCGELHVFL